MAFPIVKMGNKAPITSHSPCTMWTPCNTAICLGPPHAPPQTAVPTVEALSHTYAVKSRLVTMARQKYACPWTDLQTPPLASSLNPPDLRYQTASGSDPPFFHNALDRQTDRQTDRPTDRSRESLMTITRSASNESDAAY